MSDFLNSFVTAWEDEASAVPDPDESRAPNVNVLLRKARGRLDGNVSAGELGKEIAALFRAAERGHETLAGLTLGPLQEQALAELDQFAGLLEDLAAWSQEPREDELPELREELVTCGERLLGLQAQLALAGQRAPKEAAGREEAVPVSPEVARLYRLTQELAQGGDVASVWEACLGGLQAGFRATLAQTQAALARQPGDADLASLAGGLEAVLGGLNVMAPYPAGRDAKLLDEGWARLLEGLRQLQSATATLQSRLG